MKITFKLIRIVMFSICSALFLSLVFHDDNVSGQKKQPTKEPYKSNVPFRYVIVGNSLDDETTPQLTSRHIEVLMDKKAFSESNLKVLFNLVSKRFPVPDLLFVDVYTNLEQVLTPEERDDGTMSNRDDPDTNLYFWAIYIRGEGEEFFRFSPVNDKSSIKTFQISKKQK